MIDMSLHVHSFHTLPFCATSCGQNARLLLVVATLYSRDFIIVDAIEECVVANGFRERLF